MSLFFRRFIPLILCFVVVFGCVVSVSAREVFDYIDYSKTYEYANGTKKIVTTFDYSVDDITPTWGFFDTNNNWSYITDIDGVETEWTFYKNKPIQVKLYSAGVNNVWNISTIPDGISFDVFADVNFFSTGGVIEDPFNFGTTRYGFHVQYYDKDLEYISMQSIVAGTGEVASFHAFSKMNIPDNARYARFDCVWFECLYEGPNASIDVSMSVNKFVLSLFVPPSTASDDMLNEQEKTNDLLDDMINSNPTPEKPGGSDKVDEIGDVEQNINDSVSGGYDEFGGVVDGAVENLIAYTNTFLAVSAIFGLFADISLIKTLLVISLAIGFVSFLLNLGIAHSSNKARESARAERKSQGHKGDT